MKFTKFALASAAALGLAGAVSANDLVVDGFEDWQFSGNPPVVPAVGPYTGQNEYGVNASNTVEGAVWFGGSAEDDTTVALYSAEGSPSAYSGARNSAFTGTQNAFLKVNNAQPLWRVFTPFVFDGAAVPTKFTDLRDGENKKIDVEVGEGLYIDTLVQFTPSEDPPEKKANDGSKIIVWMNADSNLCVTASKLVPVFDGEYYVPTFIETNYYFVTSKELEVNTWYRLTVKAYAEVLADSGAGKKHGFEVYIDGQAVSSADAVIDTSDPDSPDYADVDPNLEEDVNAGKVFLAFGTPKDATLAAVGFRGEGLVDDIVVTDVDPFPGGQPAGGIDFTLNWGAGVSAVWYAIDEGDWLEATNGQKIEVPQGKSVEVDADPEPWYDIDRTTIPASIATGQSYTIVATNFVNGAAAGVNDTNLAAWTPAEIKKAFGDVEPKDLNDATAPFLDYQLGQELGDIEGAVTVKIVDIVESATANCWDIKVSVFDDDTALDINSGSASTMKATLKVRSAASLADLADDEKATVDAYDLSFADGKTVDTVTVPAARGSFFKAYIEFAGAPDLN